MKLSVSITTFDHAPFIAQALDGVLMQEVDFDYEIIVGEDCSTDGTREIVLDYAARYPERIRTVLPEQNLGGGGKHLFAETLALCRGQYIAFMDGDDYWTSPNKLAAQVRLLDERPDATMCYHNVLKVSTPAGQLMGPYNVWESDRETTLCDLLSGCVVASCSPVFRREVLVPLPHWYFSLHYGDWPLYLVAAQRGRIVYMAPTMGVYRIHGDGMWSGQGESPLRRKQFVEFYEAMINVLGLNHFDVARRKLETHLYRVAKDCAAGADWVAARRFAWRSLRMRPFQPLRRTLELVELVVQPRFSAFRAHRRHRQ